MHANQSAANVPYFSQLAHHHLLEADEEKELALRYRQTGDRSAANRLVTANLRFVVKVASQYRSYQLDFADLVQEGNLGLMRAVESFDPARGTRLISYAVWWIRAYIQAYILRSWSLVKVGTTQAKRRLFFSLARAKRALESQSGAAGASLRSDLAAYLGVKPEEIEEMEQRLAARDVSLETPTGDGGPTRAELIPAGDVPADVQLAEAQSRRLLNHRIAASLSKLNERERYLVWQRVAEEQATSFRDLGQQLHVSRERARQLEVRARKKLRAMLQTSLAGLDIVTDLPKAA